MSRIGIVTIGRNEGDRLIRCLDSLKPQIRQGIPVVYVDSGSTDGSCETARLRGVEVVDLDLSIPFTAARARNVGFAKLRELDPTIEYVQFLDGDCEAIEGWIDAAAQALDSDSQVVAVCGWRRERYPDRSPFNRICDIEWRMGNVGTIGAFGGDVMIRANALAAVGGYNNGVIAAEDDELSVRLRQAGGLILRLDRNCTIHDANMHHLSQWWQRAKRCGYAYAKVNSLHGAAPERKFAKEVRRVWLWGVSIPMLALVLALPTHGLSLIAFLRYPLTALRVMVGTRRREFSWAESLPWGLSCGFSVFPETLGLIRFNVDRLQNKQAQIIEYKGAETPLSSAIQTIGR